MLPIEVYMDVVRVMVDKGFHPLRPLGARGERKMAASIAFQGLCIIDGLIANPVWGGNKGGIDEVTSTATPESALRASIFAIRGAISWNQRRANAISSVIQSNLDHSPEAESEDLEFERGLRSLELQTYKLVDMRMFVADEFLVMNGWLGQDHADWVLKDLTELHGREVPDFRDGLGLFDESEISRLEVDQAHEGLAIDARIEVVEQALDVYLVQLADFGYRMLVDENLGSVIFPVKDERLFNGLAPDKVAVSSLRQRVKDSCGDVMTILSDMDDRIESSVPVRGNWVVKKKGVQAQESSSNVEGPDNASKQPSKWNRFWTGS